MRRLIATLIFAATVMMTRGAPAPYPITIDSRVLTAPDLLVYRSAQSVIRVSYADGGVKSDVTGLTPFCAWSTNSDSATARTSSWAYVVATNGTVDFTFAPSSVNYTPGRYIYQVGLTQTSGVASVYREGVFTIHGSPYASGAAIGWTTNITIGAYTWLGQFPATAIGNWWTNAPTSAVSFASNTWAATRPWFVSPDGTNMVWTNAPTGASTNGLLGPSGTNGVWLLVDGTNWVYGYAAPISEPVHVAWTNNPTLRQPLNLGGYGPTNWGSANLGSFADKPGSLFGGSADFDSWDYNGFTVIDGSTRTFYGSFSMGGYTLSNGVLDYIAWSLTNSLTNASVALAGTLADGKTNTLNQDVASRFIANDGGGGTNLTLAGTNTFPGGTNFFQQMVAIGTNGTEGALLKIVGSSVTGNIYGNVQIINPADGASANAGLSFVSDNTAQNTFFTIIATTAGAARPGLYISDTRANFAVGAGAVVGLERTSSTVLAGTRNDMLIYNSYTNRAIIFGTRNAAGTLAGRLRIDPSGDIQPYARMILTNCAMFQAMSAAPAAATAYAQLWAQTNAAAGNVAHPMVVDGSGGKHDLMLGERYPVTVDPHTFGTNGYVYLGYSEEGQSWWRHYGGTDAGTCTVAVGCCPSNQLLTMTLTNFIATYTNGTPAPASNAFASAEWGAYSNGYVKFLSWDASVSNFHWQGRTTYGP